MTSVGLRWLRTARGALRAEHVVIFLFALALRVNRWLNTGTSVVRDSHRYIEWCGEFSASTLFGSRAIAYSGYWLPYCGWRKLTGGWVDGWIAIQIVLSALSCLLVYETAKLLVDNRAGVVAGLAFAAQWEVYRWLVRPQSELMMSVAVAVALWRLAHYHLDPTRRNRLLALAGLGFVATVRPNGLPIVLGYVVYDLLPEGSGRRLNLFFSARVNLAIAGAILSAIAYRLRFGWARGSVLVHWREGIIVTPERVVYEYVPAPADGVLEFFVVNAGHVLAIVMLRLLWFFSPVMPGWSRWHALMGGVPLALLTVAATAGIYAAARTDRHLLVLWGTPLAMVLLTAMGTWVAGWRNFLGPAAVVYALFAGYYVSSRGWLPWLNRIDEGSAGDRSTAVGGDGPGQSASGDSAR